MENEFFLINAGIQPPLQFQPAPSMSTWNSLSSAMETQAAALNCFLNPTWEKSTDQSVHFDSALSSMVSSPAASNSNVSNESFVIRELIAKLGNIGNSPEISPHSHLLQANGSIYSTHLNSPPKLNFPMTDQERKIPSLVKSMALNSSVVEFSPDPGFAERAARFSCFGSRSFNGRTSQVGLNNGELQQRSNPLMENGKIQRVSSSPSLDALGSQLGVQQNKNSPIQNQTEFGNSQEESIGSEQFPTRENGLKASNDLNSRKRKTVPRGKAASPPPIAAKVSEDDDNSNAKRSKVSESNGNENGPVKAEEEPKGSPNQKPLEPLKDYIHVRARRGQATDSHSLAERVRREKISERMKLLQDLVPGCNKVTGKALMLDEIINYVQSLQRQVEFLSMKLASVNTRLDFNMDSLMTKNIFQSNNSLSHPIFPIDSSATAFYSHQHQQNQGPALHSNICNGTVSSVDPLDAALCRNLSMQLPPLDGFGEGVPQYPTFCEDDLQTIVQMGFGQNLNPETVLQSQNFHAQNQGSHKKTEL